MKKRLMAYTLIVSLTGLGVGLWQFIANNGAGKSQRLAVIDNTAPVTITSSNEPKPLPSEVAQTDEGSKTLETAIPQPGPVDQIVDSDTAQPLNAEDVMAKFVATGKPEAVKQYYADRRKARAELVHARLNTEHYDPDWSSELSRRFEFARLLAPELAGINLSQADCRQTICALSIAYAGTSFEKLAPFMAHVGTALGSDAWVHHDALPDGAVIYVARADRQLPDLESKL